MKHTAVHQTQTGNPERGSARDRVLQTAADLFYTHGVHSVGINRIIAESGAPR